ncbi:Predicted lipoprotein [Flavobacteriaceae bacterium MAR_2010_188]|nr:Predicted lipoprotein [Flavobacteriaceae bacterium MAR_2010_188]
MAPIFAFSQFSIERFLAPSDSINHKRQQGLIIGESSFAALSLLGLNQLWYKDYEQSKFHTIDDFDQWLQVDKIGHVYSSYQLGRLGANAQAWSGADQKQQLIYGATVGLGLLTVFEIFDGFSQEWGFSWGDMASNVAGTGIYVGQDLLWDEQRISLKYSFHQTEFAEQRPEILGNGLAQEFIKDYNGQTYWLSANIHSFSRQSKIPNWVNIALGYSAKGMLTGDNESVNGMFVEQERRRQYFISMDIDFTRIKTKSHFLRTVFDLLNTLKMPLPTVEFNEERGIKLHAIYF